MRASLIAATALLMLTCVTRNATADPPAATARFFTFPIGDLNAIALQDGSLQQPNDGKSFIVGRPPSEVAAVLASGGAATDHLEFGLQPLLVRGKNRVLLFDTGAGQNFGPIAGALRESLRAAGVDPADVTDIFISHVHGDHVGGLLTPANALAFPTATVHISAPEWSYLSGMDAHTAQLVGIAQWQALVNTIKPKVAPFKPNADIIPGLVRAVAIQGHTPGHSGYLIGAGANTLLYFGDTLHHFIVSVRDPQWLTAFDADPPTAAASRVEFVARVAASGQLLYAVHFPFPGVGKIVKKDGVYSWVPQTLH
jgi:glyoxylase-like metal-dependent hydrolase (beta-lactamase superfamily II)